MHIIVHYPKGNSITDDQKRMADGLMRGAIQAELAKNPLIQIDMIGTERLDSDDGIRCIIFGLDSEPIQAGALMRKIGRPLKDVFKRQIVIRDGASGSNTAPLVIEDRRQKVA